LEVLWRGVTGKVVPDVSVLALRCCLKTSDCSHLMLEEQRLKRTAVNVYILKVGKYAVTP